jgi:peptidoglycan/xylan/chitin deacetylase (PgdA/CDA1 family)
VTLSRPQTLVFLSVDDFLLRNEWAGDVPVVSSKDVKPEEDFRILDLFEDFDISATLFIPGKVAELFPNKLQEVADKGFEVAAHGYLHENLSLLDEVERKQRILRAIDLLEKCVRKEVLGWRSPGLHTDDSLYKILENTHVQWCSNIELPLRFKHVPFMYKGKMELPIASIDLKLYESGFSPEKVCDKWLSILERNNEIVTIVIHPWVQLKSNERMSSLKQFLEEVASRENVKICAGSDIYRQYALQERSIYGSALSAIARLWKRFSKRAQAPISKTQKVLSHYA